VKFANIAQRTITVELTPEDCQRLAVACDAVAALVAGNAPDLGALAPNRDAMSIVESLYEAFGAALEAAALAGAVETYVPLNRAEKLTLDEMRAGKLIDPLWPAA